MQTYITLYKPEAHLGIFNAQLILDMFIEYHKAYDKRLPTMIRLSPGLFYYEIRHLIERYFFEESVYSDMPFVCDNSLPERCVEMSDGLNTLRYQYE